MIASVRDVRLEFVRKLADGEVTPGKTPDGDTVEILGAHFLADEPTIFGKPAEGYVQRELAWYMGQSLNVNDMPPPVPEIWRRVSDPEGFVNSNYGWIVFSEENGNQFGHCLAQLQADLEFRGGRQACMIYQRPSMHVDAFRNGMSDFVCTDAVHCFLRGPRDEPPTLHYHVVMRSNDAVFGYKNDLAWHEVVREMIFDELVEASGLPVELAPVTWTAASLHVYRRHWDLVRLP